MSYTYAIVLDFEATCDRERRPEPQEIIEFPSVLVDLSEGRVIDSFSTFVRPHHHPVLTAFCKQLTGIEQAQVASASPFHEVLARHQTWLDDHGLDETNALFVTCGDWDLGTMLPAQCRASVPPIRSLPPIYRSWMNLKVAYRDALGVRRAPGMAGMLRALDLPLVGRHHRGIDDCHNLARLLVRLLSEGAAVRPTRRR